MATLVLNGLAFVTSTDAATKAKHLTPPSCKSVESLTALELLVGHADLTPEPLVRNTYSLWSDGPNYLRGANIPSTKCVYDWNYTNGQPQGDPDPSASTLDLSPDLYLVIGSNVTASEWKNIRNAETNSPGTRSDGCSGDCGYLAPKTVPLGLNAFELEYNETDGTDSPSDASWTAVYELYIMTKNHNILEISTWPMTLPAEEILARQIMNRFRTTL